jgi:hypothetical protein
MRKKLSISLQVGETYFIYLLLTFPMVEPIKFVVGFTPILNVFFKYTIFLFFVQFFFFKIISQSTAEQ